MRSASSFWGAKGRRSANPPSHFRERRRSGPGKEEKCVNPFDTSYGGAAIFEALRDPYARAFVLLLEEELSHFVGTGGSSAVGDSRAATVVLLFPAMNNWMRLIVHKTASRFHLESKSIGLSASRRVARRRSISQSHPPGAYSRVPLLLSEDLVVGRAKRRLLKESGWNVLAGFKLLTSDSEHGHARAHAEALLFPTLGKESKGAESGSSEDDRQRERLFGYTGPLSGGKDGERGAARQHRGGSVGGYEEEERGNENGEEKRKEKQGMEQRRAHRGCSDDSDDDKNLLKGWGDVVFFQSFIRWCYWREAGWRENQDLSANDVGTSHIMLLELLDTSFLPSSSASPSPSPSGPSAVDTAATKERSVRGAGGDEEEEASDTKALISLINNSLSRNNSNSSSDSRWNRRSNRFSERSSSSNRSNRSNGTAVERVVALPPSWTWPGSSSHDEAVGGGGEGGARGERQMQQQQEHHRGKRRKFLVVFSSARDADALHHSSSLADRSRSTADRGGGKRGRSGGGGHRRHWPFRCSKLADVPRELLAMCGFPGPPIRAEHRKQGNAAKRLIRAALPSSTASAVTPKRRSRGAHSLQTRLDTDKTNEGGPHPIGNRSRRDERHQYDANRRGGDKSSNKGTSQGEEAGRRKTIKIRPGFGAYRPRGATRGTHPP
eukprot:jgi/Bigna1/82208/fgenesh1_pg.89_\